MSVQCIQFKTDLSLLREQGQQHQANGKAYITKCDWKPEDKKLWTKCVWSCSLRQNCPQACYGQQREVQIPCCDRIVGSRAAITSLHQIKRNCFLECSKTRLGLITWSHSYKQIVTCTQSIISVGNKKRKGES